MKLLRNARTLLRQPVLAAEYLQFQLSRARHGGEAVRAFPADDLEIGGLSGFSEFHSCARFIDARERRFLKQFPFRDGVFVDVGANLGLFSLVLARRFPQREVHAFEPNPTTFAAMRANFAQNDCPHAHAHADAVAAYDGEIVFQADPVDRATTHIVEELGSPTGGPPLIRVPCVTLDGFLVRERIDADISLLKVDVEGFEELVFRGAERLLASAQAPIVYYEVCPELTRRAGFAPQAASKRLLDHGFRLHTLHDTGELQAADLARISGVTVENWIAIKP